ncbi:MAG: response regulator [Deltaproteobacteria bacterium]|nr:response regulator [Deltaproteobacteria bacterium]
MPDLLLLSLDTKSFFALDALGTAHGFRVKSAANAVAARDWLTMRPFAVVLVDARLDTLSQRELAGQLWKANPQAPVVVFDFGEGSSDAAQEARLLGAEVAFGGKALETIAEILKKLQSQAEKPVQEFKILVVEDLDSPRDIICFYLESMGYGKVFGVRSAREALAALEKEPAAFSCVITDIRMPELDGKELIDLIRHNDSLRHLPVVALTAYGTVDTLIDCLKAGASGFLVKPPKRDDLTRELSRAMRILSAGASPRLASSSEAEMLRNLLIEKGFS